ncbi:hypothetical protein D3C71_1664360 [compost metagenome]
MCDDASNLYVVAFGLKVLDKCDRTITVTERGIEDEIPTTFYCYRTQLFSPLASVFVGMTSPCVRMFLT